MLRLFLTISRTLFVDLSAIFDIPHRMALKNSFFRLASGLGGCGSADRISNLVFVVRGGIRPMGVSRARISSPAICGRWCTYLTLLHRPARAGQGRARQGTGPSRVTLCCVSERTCCLAGLKSLVEGVYVVPTGWAVCWRRGQRAVRGVARERQGRAGQGQTGSC